ncbi:type VI secretion system Vgr family protein [Massilia antarctica]|uniref:type VI secretion system Vgr family protein n=1 Tax=Massilia antarctica TaxID=2765360 RepID=UPI0006BB89C0|nr:type VI secretion system Vgr family protein [Massilia sp. H27-R4]MCY0912647.1 type VI secretion system Vgr family protein [Massilia sp. H27-R4]CUI03710.1 probable vgr related protein [Janthinobacterium sp. CG23_2]CUU27496.1 probable vgr related protein [Janthinobacterium sp. CG23_2]
MTPLDQIVSRAAFGTGLSQHARLITLASAQDSALPESLMAEQFTGREAVNELFAFDVDALSVSTDLDLSMFIGEELTITLLQPDSTRRYWHGICTEAAWLGADGGVARYRLHLEPSLALLRLRRDSFIFQDKNARDIVAELLSDYPQVRFEFDVTQALATRPICTQYRESDLAFFERLLASEGLSWRFEHDQAPDGGDGQARHRIVIFDSRAKAPDTAGGAELRFHGVRATDTDDAIDAFRARRQVQANAVTISSWDPDQIVAPAAGQHSALAAGELPPMAVYDGSGERIASASEVAGPHSQLMLQALELDNKTFEGEGAVRRLAAGHAFRLTQHERYGNGANGFTVLWVTHEARNNYQPGIAATARAGVEAGTYRNRFGCVRDMVAIVPRATALAHAASALGPQTALVVGLENAVSTTARQYHVKIQFPWQRGHMPVGGGMAHNLDVAGNAPGNESSGTWVRVAEALAGPNWGTQFTPRIGTEVLVDFIEGDMDRPVVVAQLYTGADMPPFSAGVDSGVNHGGVLSGIHSHNFEGNAFNQWQLDDTQGQVRTRLATSSAATQLNLGYLIAQQAGSAQRGRYRGSGFELRTDAWAVVRGAEGVMLTTSARKVAGSGIESTQLDAAEAVGMLKHAKGISDKLAGAAAQQNALFSKEAGQAQADFIDLIDPEARARFPGAVSGQEALKAKHAERQLDTAKPVERFGKAVVLMESAASINWATPASTLLYAGEQLHWTTQSDMHMTAGETISSVSGKGSNLFTHAGGIQVFAGNGPVSLQAHTDALEILADKSITVISVNNNISINAQQKIVLQVNGASVTLDGADITFSCSGHFSVLGSLHPWGPAGGSAAVLEALPDTRAKLFDQGFVVTDEVTGKPLPNQRYRIKLANGNYEEGVTDEEGRTHVVSSVAPEGLSLDVAKG